MSRLSRLFVDFTLPPGELTKNRIPAESAFIKYAEYFGDSCGFSGVGEGFGLKYFLTLLLIFPLFKNALLKVLQLLN